LNLRLPTAGFDGASVPNHQSGEQLPYLEYAPVVERYMVSTGQYWHMDALKEPIKWCKDILGCNVCSDKHCHFSVSAEDFPNRLTV
jgi:hypothetical protein